MSSELLRFKITNKKRTNQAKLAWQQKMRILQIKN